MHKRDKCSDYLTVTREGALCGFFVVATQEEGLSGEEKDDEGHDGIDRPYNSFCCISANDVAKRSAIVQEAELVRQGIEQRGFLPGTVEPVYAVAVVEHCESLRSCSLAAIHILDISVRPLPYVKRIYAKNT